MKILIMLAITLTLLACGSDESEETEPTVGKEIADHYNRAMDKAREVEDQVMEQKQKIDEALQEAEGKVDEDT